MRCLPALHNPNPISVPTTDGKRMEHAPSGQWNSPGPFPSPGRSSLGCNSLRLIHHRLQSNVCLTTTTSRTLSKWGWHDEAAPSSPHQSHLHLDGAAANGSDCLPHKVYIHLRGIFLQLGQHLPWGQVVSTWWLGETPTHCLAQCNTPNPSWLPNCGQIKNLTWQPQLWWY